VPHPFASFLANGWETAKAKSANSCGAELVELAMNGAPAAPRGRRIPFSGYRGKDLPGNHRQDNSRSDKLKTIARLHQV
jgi:hypothetical protein